MVNYPSEKIWLWRHRTDSPGSGKQKRIASLSPRGSCPLLFQEALEMIDYWGYVWWILAADNLTLEEVKGDFGIKNLL